MVTARFGYRDADEIEQIGQVGAAHVHLESRPFQLGRAGQRAGHVHDAPGALGMQPQPILAAGERGVGALQCAFEGERMAPRPAGAGEPDLTGEARIARLDRAESDIGGQLHFGIAVAQIALVQGRAADHRQLQRLAFHIGIAEGPGVAPPRRIPFQIDIAIDQVQPVGPPIAENQRNGGDFGIDQARVEEIVIGRPFGVRHRHPLGKELDVDRIEIELKITADLHLSPRLSGDDRFEGGC